jgi:methylated-DNA-[protein]-cysteine S-methyltransferase
MPTLEHFLCESPIGTLTLIKSGGVLSGLYLEQYRHGPSESPGARVTHGFEREAEQLAEYFAGERTEFSLLLAPEGTPYQERVWKTLQAIPFGETWSYKQLAQAVGGGTVARAVGSANARNPISIVIPCHRVIGAGGTLVGYGGGLESKRFLLEHESAASRLAFDAPLQR